MKEIHLGYAYSKREVIHKFIERCPDFNKEIIDQIVNKLHSLSSIYYSEIIFNLYLESGGTQAVAEFLYENINESIRVFNFLYNHMKENHQYQDLIKYMKNLENTKLDEVQREKIYNCFTEIAGLTSDEKLRNEYLYKVNDLNPQLRYTIEICKALDNAGKINELEKLEANFVETEENQDEKLLIQLILGKIENAYSFYEKLEKYQKDKIGDLIILYLLKFGNKDVKEKTLLTSQLSSEINAVDLSLDTAEVLRIMNETRNKKIDKEFIAKIEEIFEKEINKKTNKVLGRDRGLYGAVATDLATLIEYFEQEGRYQEANYLFMRFQKDFKRYNAYTRELRKIMKKNNILQN